MDKQEIFNKVWDWSVIKQMPKSIHPTRVNTNGNPSCLYRSPNGSKCFIGVLIPDEMYHEDLENCTVSHISVREVFRKMDVTLNKDMFQYLDELQSIHDYTKNDINFNNHCKNELLEFAKKNDLSVPQI